MNPLARGTPERPGRVRAAAALSPTPTSDRAAAFHQEATDG